MVGIIVTIFILGIAVVVHEFGHFLVMRRNGIKVLEFAVGFGPRLLAWQRSEGCTVYSIRAIPLGGFVNPAAEGPESMTEAIPWVKFKVAIAGPMMNCLLAFVIGLGLLYANPNVGILQNEWLAWLPLHLRPLALAFAASFGVAIITPGFVAYLAVTNFMSLFGGLAGPIGIVQMGSRIGGADPTVQSVVMGSLFFMCMINVGIAGANLMPLNPLDGGHCVRAIMSKIPCLNNPTAFKIFNYGTAGLMILLIVVVFTSDILRLTGISLGS